MGCINKVVNGNLIDTAHCRSCAMGIVESMRIDAFYCRLLHHSISLKRKIKERAEGLIRIIFMKRNIYFHDEKYFFHDNKFFYSW